ncbi:hypothetical protein ACTOWA_15745 [Herbaspirillum seropedicae]|uniref:hypothetical protein n=1 Tax=Herbaspirillum seropedicae TaxID=964 RepID=UPI003F8D47BE
MKWSALFLAAGLFSGSAWGGAIDAIPTCYDNKMVGAPTGVLDTELFVAIDQTTLLDGGLKQSVADNLKPFLAPGNGFQVVTFSAYTQGHYTEVLASGKLDAPMEANRRNDVSKTALAKFDQCMGRQPQLAAQIAGGALRAAFDGTSGEIAKSDVLASLKAIADLSRKSKARNKIVLLVSDMLENSSVSSFYADRGHSVRKIDPAKEMQLVEQNQLLGDFGGARVYVIGAGLLSEDGKKSKSYRDPKTMQALATFWKTYLEKSGAQLVEFGQPALLSPIR